MSKSQFYSFHFFWYATSIFLIALGLYSIPVSSWAKDSNKQANITQGSCKTNWMYQGQIGLSTHFFPMKIDGKEEFVSRFQAQTIADQSAEAGVSWFLLSLHHESWIMIAPNTTYDRIMGTSDYTTERDVPLELQQQLQAKGIKLMLYVNLKLSPNTDRRVPKAMGGWPPNDKLIENIAEIYREYSLRYGNKVAGWWVDGAQNIAYQSSPKREQWFKIIADALRAGNSSALVTFVPGLGVDRYTQNADYTAGESENLEYYPSSRWVDGAQWHLWTYLGGWWSSGGTRYSEQELGDYVALVTSRGGALTFEVGTQGVDIECPAKYCDVVKKVTTPYFGYIDPLQVNQIKALKKYRLSAVPESLSNCVN